uniref:CARD domain-containing protein n=1 Tax=Plectus sambesii TaxID=2011161 RepID=A0A914X9X4_9BILA
MAATSLPSLKKEHIAVITCDDSDLAEMRHYFDANEIPCGQVNEQARKLKSSSSVAVDVYLNTPSYEWPIVFVVLKPGVTKDEVMPIAASRCIASLTIITYKNVHSHRPKSALMRGTGSVKADNNLAASLPPYKPPVSELSAQGATEDYDAIESSIKAKDEQGMSREEIFEVLMKHSENDIKQRVLRKNLHLFCEELKNVEVINLLQAENVLRPVIVQEIETERGSYKQNRVLYDSLMQRPKDDLLKLFDILIRTNQKKVAEKLVWTLRSSVK